MADTYIAPTPERLAKAAHWDIPSDKQVINGREVTKTERGPTRVGNVVEKMYRKGEITYDQNQAFKNLDRLHTLAEESLFARPNPVGIVVDDAGLKCRHSRRIDARTKYQGALSAVGLVNAIVLRHCMLEIATQETVGRKLSIGQAIAKSTAILHGKKAIREATYALALHFGHVLKPPNA